LGGGPKRWGATRPGPEQGERKRRGAAGARPHAEERGLKRRPRGENKNHWCPPRRQRDQIAGAENRTARRSATSTISLWELMMRRSATAWLTTEIAEASGGGGGVGFGGLGVRGGVAGMGCAVALCAETTPVARHGVWGGPPQHGSRGGGGLGPSWPRAGWLEQPNRTSRHRCWVVGGPGTGPEQTRGNGARPQKSSARERRGAQSVSWAGPGPAAGPRRGGSRHGAAGGPNKKPEERTNQQHQITGPPPDQRTGKPNAPIRGEPIGTPMNAPNSRLHAKLIAMPRFGSNQRPSVCG